jgi:hypothetical protein
MLGGAGDTIFAPPSGRTRCKCTRRLLLRVASVMKAPPTLVACRSSPQGPYLFHREHQSGLFRHDACASFDRTGLFTNTSTNFLQFAAREYDVTEFGALSKDVFFQL